MPSLRLDSQFWRGRRVFVTGHSGFVGGWVCLWLSQLGARVAGYALAPATSPNMFEAAGVGQRLRSTIADIRDLPRLTCAMTDFAPEVVLHLAAQPLVGRAFAAPVESYASNTMGTINTLEAIRKCPSVASAVMVTTDKVYESREWAWSYRETDTLGGHDPYSSSKACAELAVDAFRRSYFSNSRRIGIATVRAGNIVGGGDWSADRLVPDAVRAFAAREPLAIRNPVSVRPWQHVIDPVRGYLAVAERLADDPAGWSGAWNFGPAEDEAWAVGRVADEMVRLWDDGARWISLAPATKGAAVQETATLTLSSAKARSRLGWRPVWPLQRALAATVDWYKAHIAGRDMQAFTLDQVALAEGAN